MRIQDRMDEFKKVSNRDTHQKVEERMKDFNQVIKETKEKQEEKESALPYGFKRYRACPECGEFMEIHSIKDKKAFYCCHHCGNKASYSAGKEEEQ